MEKDILWIWTLRGKRKAGVAILVPDNIDFKTKAIARDKEGPNSSISGYLSEWIQNTTLEGHVHPYVHCSIIYSSQDTEATCVSISEWMDKEEVVHIYNGILLNHEERIKSCHLQQHGWTERVLCWVAFFRQRKTNAIWFHWHVEFKE